MENRQKQQEEVSGGVKTDGLTPLGARKNTALELCLAENTILLFRLENMFPFQVDMTQCIWAKG